MYFVLLWRFVNTIRNTLLILWYESRLSRRWSSLSSKINVLISASDGHRASFLRPWPLKSSVSHTKDSKSKILLLLNVIKTYKKNVKCQKHLAQEREKIRFLACQKSIECFYIWKKKKVKSKNTSENISNLK